MKNKKTWIAAGVLVLLLIAAVACWMAFAPQTTAGRKTVNVEVTHKDGTVNAFELKTEAEFLGEAMQEAELLEGTDGPYGMYVLTVDGETVNEQDQEWWGYTKSGETVNYGVDMCPIADGDHYEFTLNVGW